MDASYSSLRVGSQVARCFIPCYSVNSRVQKQYTGSTRFQCGGLSWEVQVRVEDKSISVHVLLRSSGYVVATAVKVGVEGPTETRTKETNFYFNSKDKECGFPQFLDKTEVDRFLVNDRLSFFVVVKMVFGQYTIAGDVPGPLELEETPDLGRALLDSAGDVEFRVQGEKIMAHKLVLATRSPVFRAQLEAKMLKVDDIRPPVFKAMLVFLYTDSINGNVPLVQDLLEAAAKYQLDELHTCCVDFLCLNFTKQTVARSFELAEKHQISELKDACLSFVDQTTAGTEFLNQGFTNVPIERQTVVAETKSNEDNHWWQRVFGKKPHGKERIE